MSLDIKFAQVNALKISDALCHELISGTKLAHFFAFTLGERNGRVDLNRYEYMLDKIYPIVYQHLTADTPLDEETLAESAKLLLPHVSNIIDRTCEDVAKHMVKTWEWERLYNTITPLPGVTKQAWDIGHTKLYDDAVCFVSHLVRTNCTCEIRNARVSDWYSGFCQKSFGLDVETPENSNATFEKANIFKGELDKTSFVGDGILLWGEAFFQRLTQQLQSSRDLIARHSAWPTIEVAAPQERPTDQKGELEISAPSTLKMNRR